MKTRTEAKVLNAGGRAIRDEPGAPYASVERAQPAAVGDVPCDRAARFTDPFADASWAAIKEKVRRR